MTCECLFTLDWNSWKYLHEYLQNAIYNTKDHFNQPRVIWFIRIQNYSCESSSPVNQLKYPNDCTLQLHNIPRPGSIFSTQAIFCFMDRSPNGFSDITYFISDYLHGYFFVTNGMTSMYWLFTEIITEYVATSCFSTRTKLKLELIHWIQQIKGNFNQRLEFCKSID